MATWYEDDSFWESLGPFLFSCFRTDETTLAESDQIIRLLRLAPGAKILDLCCGRGRHSLEFARRGFAVTGVDRTDRYLDTARSLAAKENLPIEFIREAGFSDVTVYGSLEGTPYDQTAKRLVAVATKERPKE